MIAAIYESVIRPELYDDFMDAWDSHIHAAIAAHTRAAHEVPPDSIEIDPELGAHFARAYEILEQIGRKVPAGQPLDRITGGETFALALSTKGGTLAASATARGLLGEAATLSALRAELAVASDEVLSQLMRLAREGGGDTVQPVVLSTSLEPRHLLARIEPALDGPSPAVVIEAMHYSWSAPAEAMLVASFGLTRAEVDIVRHLLAGRSLRQIADQSGRSEHTVRNQAKAVLAKTGAPGQVDLIRLIVFLINQLDTRKGDGRAAPLPFDMERASDGREIQICRLGAQGKRPVLFFHGMLDGMAPLNFLRDEFHRRGLSVIAPARPGFGRSSPVARYDRAIDAFAGDIAALIEREGLDRPLIFTQMGGGLYGHALACRLGRRVAGLVAVSAPTPITRLSQFAHMAPRQRVVAYTARFAPALLPTVLRAGIAQIDGEEIEDFMSALYKPGTHEHGVIQRLGLAPLLREGFRFAVEQGPAGFATDSHFIVRDWSHEIEHLETRAIYLMGEHDPVISAQSVADAMNARANVEARIIAGAGQLLAYERPDIVFAAIDEVFAAADA